MRTQPLNSWPHPFDDLLQTTLNELRFRRGLPLDFASSTRTAVTDKVINHLLRSTTQADLEPDQLSALNSFIAALIVCPESVALLYVDTNLCAPDFLLSDEQIKQRDLPEQALTDAHIRVHEAVPKRVGLCGTCLTEFSLQPLTVRLGYEAFEAELAIYAPEMAAFSLVAVLQCDPALFDNEVRNSKGH